MKTTIKSYFSSASLKHFSFLFFTVLSFTAIADPTPSTFDHYYLQGGTYTHYYPDKDHQGPDIFVSLEAVKSDQSLYGLALFDNSFGQFSQYLYTGKSWNFSGDYQHYHVKLTGGLIHGYRGEYRDKIPFNRLGIAPAIIPGIGYDNEKYGADVIMLGISGLLFTVGMKL